MPKTKHTAREEPYEANKLAVAADAFARLLLGNPKAAIEHLSALGVFVTPPTDPASYNLHARLTVALHDAARRVLG